MRLSFSKSTAWGSALLALAFSIVPAAQCQSVQIAVYSDTTCEKLITIFPATISGTGCFELVPGFDFDSALLSSSSVSGPISEVYMCQAGFNCDDPGSQTENLIEGEDQCIGAIGSTNFDKFEICATVQYPYISLYTERECANYEFVII